MGRFNDPVPALRGFTEADWPPPRAGRRVEKRALACVGGVLMFLRQSVEEQLEQLR